MPILARLASRLRRWRFWGLGLAALLALYAGAGFLLLPALIKAQLPPRLGAFLQREVQLRAVRANPFTLSLTLEGFRVRDRDGAAFFGFDRLYVNLQARSLFTRTLDFKAIDLASPRGRVILERDGRLNFSDILARLAEPDRGPAPEGRAGGREIAIGHLRVSRAEIALLDRTPEEPFATTLGPVTIELKGFHTAFDRRNPYALSGRTESGETFAWHGSFSLEPLRSAGTVVLEDLALPKYNPYLKERVAFKLQDGLATVRAAYDFEWTAGRHTVKVGNGSLDLRNLKLSGRDTPAVRLFLPSVAVRGLEADLLDSRLAVASVTLAGVSADAVRDRDGSIDLVRLLTPKPQPPPANPKPFRLSLRELDLEDCRFSLEDRAPPRAVTTQLDQASLHLKDIDFDPATRVRVDLEGRVNGRGRIRAEGTAGLLRPAADLALKVENLDLPAFDAYLEPALDVRVNRGTLNLDGRLKGIFQGGGEDFAAFKGNLRLEGFEAMDGARQEVFLRYRSLRLGGLDVRTTPAVLNIQSAELVEPEHRLVVAEDGSTNVARALKLTLDSAAAAAAPPTPPAPFAVSIARAGLRGGRLSFVDRSLEPNAALMISELEGTYTGLSTRPDSASAVDLKGRAGGTAPIRIQGRATPLRHDLDTDVNLKIEGAELSDFSPYAGKYLGYAIRKGKLELDARLVIRNRRLEIQDQVRLDQFFLGDKVDSPDATRLPVKLALALLRDRKGVMELELPIDGSLDDPDFHYGRIVWKAIANVLGKIAASPFTLLGKLFGGADQDLSFAAFAPGSAAPDAAARKTVEVLRKSLAGRPDLSIEVEAATDSGADPAALRRQALDAALVLAKVKALRRGQPDLDPDAVVVGPGERERWLRALFETAFPPPAPEKGKSPPPPPPLAELEQRLLGTFPVTSGDLKRLADARAKAMVRLLLEDGTVEASRVFETEGGERVKREGGSRAYFSIR